MKYLPVFASIIFLLSSACSDSNPEPIGAAFTIDTPISLYLENGAHEDLLAKNEGAKITFLVTTKWHQYRSSALEENTHRYQIKIPAMGHFGEKSFQYYLLLPDGDMDTLDVRYNFLKINNTVQPILEALHYNGALISEGFYTNNQQHYSHEQVYVMKQGDLTETSWSPFEDTM